MYAVHFNSTFHALSIHSAVFSASTRLTPVHTPTGLPPWRHPSTSAPQGAAGSASDIFNPTKRTVTSTAFARTLRRLGIEYRQPPRHPLKTTRALRLLYCVEGLERVALTGALYRAYWVEGRDVSELEVLRSVVKGCEG